jgi:hypothetical protein
MDSAQLGRQIARGKGFTTLFVRPFSMYLVRRHNVQRHGQPALGSIPDYAELRDRHPDLANPPVYPLILAGLMKVLPFHYPVDAVHPFWSTFNSRSARREFYRSEPDFLIAAFNEVLLLVLAWLVFCLARRLFDAPVGWVSALLLLGTEQFWHFSVSGLSTILLMLIFFGLSWCVLSLEKELREPGAARRRVILLALLAGALVGVGGLTRYAFGWLVIPVIVFAIIFGGERRIISALAVLAGFVVVMSPWVARNYHVGGTPFGTAGYAIIENTGIFPGDRLERTLEPDFSRISFQPLGAKLMGNLRQIAQSDLPRLGGSWVAAFFLVGLLVNFRNPELSRLRYFLLMSVAVLSVAQALGRTQLSDESPEINSENLLVLVAPLVLLYGAGFFMTLLDQVRVPFREARYIIIALFSFFVCLPMIFAFLPPKTVPIAYPPYYPPLIQTASNWLKEKEMAMSDVPWAVAWYGDRQCVWLTLKCAPDPRDPDSHEDFFAINDYQKKINLLYLTPVTMDSRFLSQWIRAGEQSWGRFVLDTILAGRVPNYFPLNKSQPGWLPEQIALTDWERWSNRTPGN